MSERRVVRIITRLNIGGPSIQAITLSRELGAAGFSSLLIHGKLGEAEGDMTGLIGTDGVTMEYVDDLVRPVSPLRDLRALWRIYRALRRWRPHIVHTHMAKAGALGRLAAVAYNWTTGRSQRTRMVHTYHGHVFEGYFGGLSTKVFLAVERWLGKRSDRLIAISAQVQNDLVKTYAISDGRNVVIVPLGFKLEKLARVAPADRLRARAVLDIAPDTLVVSTVGRLTAIKQHGLLLDAFRQALARDGRLRLLIVGDGELRAELEQQVKSAGLDATVRFLGWRGDLDVIYGATDIFMLTSRNEGTPVALIEAMAAGVAAVSTDVGGVRDVITSPAEGTLVPFGDAAALTEAMLRFAGDAGLRDATGRAARASVVGRFDQSRLVGDIRRLYERMLEPA